MVKPTSTSIVVNSERNLLKREEAIVDERRLLKRRFDDDTLQNHYYITHLAQRKNINCKKIENTIKNLICGIKGHIKLYKHTTLTHGRHYIEVSAERRT